MMLRARIPHLETNEKEISLYARFEKITAEKNLIYSLIDDSGTLQQGSHNVMKVVHDFYSNLYTRDPECSDSQKYFLDKIDKKVSDEERMALDKDFTPDEVRK